jgi:hypothetical protein
MLYATQDIRYLLRDGCRMNADASKQIPREVMVQQKNSACLPSLMSAARKSVAATAGQFTSSS